MSNSVDKAGLLRPVTNEQARAKVGAFGSQGTGKTTTLALLALAVSKLYHNGAPVAMQDTENGSDYLEPIFKAEGVQLLVHKSGAFADMTKVLREAEQLGCCAFIMDSVTHTWRELVESYCARKAAAHNWKTYAPQFQDWKDIKAEWGRWTAAFLNSQVHCFIAGRAGYEYEYQENDETGKKELIKGDTKMKAEGEFGYEPSLLIEMVAERAHTENGHGGSFLHIAYILKDRARALNGKHFEFPDINEYKPGEWQRIFEPFKPHFAFLNLQATQRAIGANTSEELFDEGGNSDARRRTEAKKITLEEIENMLGTVLWPGTSTEMKQARLSAMQVLWSVRAWSAVCTFSLKNLEDGLFALQEYEKAQKDAQPSNADEIMALLRECFQRVKQPAYVPIGARIEGAL